MYVSRQIDSCVLCNAIAHMVINAIVVYLDNPFRLCQQTIHSSPFVIVKDNFPIRIIAYEMVPAWTVFLG